MWVRGKCGCQYVGQCVDLSMWDSMYICRIIGGVVCGCGKVWMSVYGAICGTVCGYKYVRQYVYAG